MPAKLQPTTGIRRTKEIALRPLHPNAGLEAAYRKKLRDLIEEMSDSVEYWLEVEYKRNEPRMAMDSTPERAASLDIFGDPNVVPPDGDRKFLTSAGKVVSWNDLVATMAMDDGIPANALQRALDKLAKRWLKRFDEGAPELAKYFAKSVWNRTDKNLQAILRKAGFSVRFTMTKPMHDVVNATIQQNVELIKSIPQQYLKDVQGAVMRSIQTGRDLGSLTTELKHTYGVTDRRAAFIARSQNNLATSAMNRARQAELGITQAKWRHSGAGKHPRPTHVANNDKLYDVAKGWWDPAVKRYIFPGTEPNCRCVSISVIPGLE
jgi:SPP1 gp7 family putative phage head morphogenesis protein